MLDMEASLDGYQEFYEAKVKRLNDDGTLKEIKHSDGDIQQLKFCRVTLLNV